MLYKNIKKVIEVIENDGVVIIPTDTIYGYSCKIDSIVGIEKIRELKQRDRDKPFLILDSNLERVKNYFIETENSAVNILIDKLIEKQIWPNNLTLISEKNTTLNKYSFLKNLNTVAVRYTTNETIKEITSQLNTGILSTSINISGEKELTSFSEIFEHFSKNKDIDYILNIEKESKNTTNSTIIKLDINLNNNNILNIIREGDINIIRKIKLLQKEFYDNF